MQEDLDTIEIDRLIDQAEATYNNFRHPNPYIVPWAPGGSKFTRNPAPPQGVSVYDLTIILFYYDELPFFSIQSFASLFVHYEFRPKYANLRPLCDNPAHHGMQRGL
ncbi:hypothetical protein QQ045_010292 [Rhodiola kirilowii]